MTRVWVKDWRDNAHFWALTAFLVLVFFTGGGSRPDIQSLIILRPIAVLVCGAALWTLKREQVQAYRFVFSMTAAIFALVIIHLIPLPPVIWGALPGRQIMTEVDKVAELGSVWRPISMVPSMTWNAFYAIFVPLAVLLLGVQLTREQRFRLLPIVLGLGLFSGFWGLMQTIGAPDGPLYLYEVTNNGSAVGLFANRNHQAVLLASLFPMLAVYACTDVKTVEAVRIKGWIAVAVGMFLVPLILVTGSRAGLLISVFELVMAAILYRRPTIAIAEKRKVKKFDMRIVFGTLSVFALGGLTVIMSRAEAFRRLFAAGQSEDDRFQIWGPVASMGWKYFPIGSGVGSFAQIFQIDEPNSLLTPEYFNHAHNDFLELWMTIGVPGIIVAVVTTVALIRSINQACRADQPRTRNGRFQLLGIATFMAFVLGSVGDYPLRTPATECIFVIAVLWLGGKPWSVEEKAGGSSGVSLGQKPVQSLLNSTKDTQF